MSSRCGYLAILLVLSLMAVTLYMAFAFPFTIFQAKQVDSTEIKAVIIVGRDAEISPSPECYFQNELPDEELRSLGYGELTNVGKERMYQMGKLLKNRYYDLLLEGNPRKIHVRSADSDSCLESAQAFIAGLNPPKDQWLWSSSGELNSWQPIAIHSKDSNNDDVLSSESNCPKLDQILTSWQGTSEYLGFVEQFHQDIQIVHSNTGLQFGDNLAAVTTINDYLKRRKSYKNDLPAWCTDSFMERISSITRTIEKARYNSKEVQRLYIGRLLHEIMENINMIIQRHVNDINVNTTDPTLVQTPQIQATTMKLKQNFNMFVYITNKDRLAALLSSLQLYSDPLEFGSQLIIELHFDSVNKRHFLRFFYINSSDPNSMPEPYVVKSTSCSNSEDCTIQQLQLSLSPLMLRGSPWHDACSANNLPQSFENPKPFSENTREETAPNTASPAAIDPLTELITDQSNSSNQNEPISGLNDASNKPQEGFNVAPASSQTPRVPMLPDSTQWNLPTETTIAPNMNVPEPNNFTQVDINAKNTQGIENPSSMLPSNDVQSIESHENLVTNNQIDSTP